jgi:hypothetical protein
MIRPGDGGRDRSWVVAVAAVCVAVLAVSAAVVVLVLTGARSSPGVGSSLGVGSMTLEAAGVPGVDPFTPSVAGGVAVALTGAVVAEGAAVRRSLPTDASTHTRVVSGTAPGLYGGSGDVHVCDPRQLVAFLNGHPGKAAAWARVLGIAPGEIGGYVAALTPVVLTGDTLVGNHGYRAGAATTLLSVLQAGTAVLVDASGIPRVKCNCGNPLTPPELINLAGAATRGAAWPGYAPAGVTAVRAGTATGTLRVVNVTTGALYDQPVSAPPGGGANLDLHTVDWTGVTVTGRACMSETDITLHHGVAAIPASAPGGSYQLKLTIQPQYGQLGNGGPRVAAFGLSCFGLGNIAGNDPVKRLGIAVFGAAGGQPKLLSLITTLDLGNITGDPSAYGALVPDRIRVQDGTVVVTGVYLRGQDARCCPSGRGTSTLSYNHARLVWAAPVSSNGAASPASPANPASPAAPTAPSTSGSAGPLRIVTVTTPTGQRLRVSVLAQDTVADCAANAYGSAVISFLTQHPCDGATRLLFTIPLGGRTVALSLITTGFAGIPGQPYIYATQFAQLENESGTGSINDLLRAGTRPPGWPAAIPAAEAFDVTGQDAGLWIFDAWYLSGPTTPQAPELISLERDLFLQPITGPSH